MTDLLAAPAPSSTTSPGRAVPAWARMLGLTGALGVVLTLLLAIFIMPSLKSGPRDLPVGIVASDPTAATVEATLTDAAPGATSPSASARSTPSPTPSARARSSAASSSTAPG